MRLIQIDYHRNGVTGNPFFALLIKHEGKTFLITANEHKPEETRVICVDMIKDHGVTFAINSWRPEYFMPFVGDCINTYNKSHESFDSIEVQS